MQTPWQVLLQNTPDTKQEAIIAKCSETERSDDRKRGSEMNEWEAHSNGSCCGNWVNFDLDGREKCHGENKCLVGMMVVSYQAHQARFFFPLFVGTDRVSPFWEEINRSRGMNSIPVKAWQCPVTRSGSMHVVMPLAGPLGRDAVRSVSGPSHQYGAKTYQRWILF